MSKQPHLSFSERPSPTPQDGFATPPPARGKEMRQNLVSRMRAPALVHSWDFYHDRQHRSIGTSTRPQDDGMALAPGTTHDGGADTVRYEDRLVLLTSISDVREFWSMFNNFDISAMALRDSVHLFHKGVRPIWEDGRNARGGSWTFRVPKEHAGEFWKEVCMLAIGEQLQEAVSSSRVTFVDDICGVSLSVRFISILVQIWNRDADHVDGIKRILSTVRERLPEHLRPLDTAFYYKRHSEHAAFSMTPKSRYVPGDTVGHSLTRGKDLPPTDTLYTLSSAERLEIEDEEHAVDLTGASDVPKIHVPKKGFKSNAEALQQNEEVLSGMKKAMDVIGSRTNK